MMVFEYAPNGSLFEHLHGKQKRIRVDKCSRNFSIVAIETCFSIYDFDAGLGLSASNQSVTVA